MLDVKHLQRAREIINGIAVKTPLLQSPLLNAMLEGQVFLKCENLQRTGSFKFRGAYHAIFNAKKGGASHICAASSGNHAQGVACASQMLGVRASIVMPADAPKIKLSNTRRYGAEIITYDRHGADRQALASEICAKHNASMVHAYDHFDVMAGQGTLGLEVIEQLPSGLNLDHALINTAGGGVTAGTATALRSRFANVKIWAAEPEHFDDYANSLRQGAILPHHSSEESICDALLAPAPGALTFPINLGFGCKGLVADEAAVKRAVQFAFEQFKLVVEPGGAVGLACLLENQSRFKHANTLLVLTGGNVDAALFASIIGG